MQLRICERIKDSDCRVKTKGIDEEGYYSFSVECDKLWLAMTKPEKEKLMRSHDLSTRNALSAAKLCPRLTKEEMDEWLKLMEWEAFHGVCPAVIPNNLNKFRSSEAALQKAQSSCDDAQAVSF